MKNEYGASNFTVSVWRVADELVESTLKAKQQAPDH
jgi:hypothetical protein